MDRCPRAFWPRAALILLLSVVVLLISVTSSAEIYRLRGFNGCSSVDEGTPGLDEGIADCGPVTGAVWTYATAIAGAVGATALQYWYLPITPTGSPATVSIDVDMIIAHGTVSMGAPQFMGTYKVYATGTEANQTKIEMDSWLDTQIAISKILAILSPVIPGVPATDDMATLIGWYMTFLDAIAVEEAWQEGANAGNAEPVSMSFNYTVGGSQTAIEVWAGVRSQAVGFGLGSATATASGIVKSIRVSGIDPPVPVVIAGPDSVIPDYPVAFQFSVPGNLEDVRYVIDWDNGQGVQMTDFVPGDSVMTVTHTFNDLGGYLIWVKAEEHDGLRSEIREHHVTSEDGAPGRVEDVSATDGTDCNQVTITWDPEARAQWYTVWTANPGNQVSGDVYDTVWEHTSALPNDQKSYFVIAHNNHGDGYAFNPDLGHRKAAPEPAFGLTVDNPYDCAIEVSWAGYPQGLGLNNEVDLYSIHRNNIDDFFTSTVVDTFPEDGTGNHTWYDMPQVADTYHYWIVAHNECGYSPSPETMFTVWNGSVFPAPHSLTASNDECAFVQLNWGGLASNVRVLRDGQYTDTTGVYWDYEYRDHDAIPGVVHQYQVEAWNVSCNGGVPGERTLPVAGSRWHIASSPDTLQASDGQYCDFVRVSWTPVTHASQYHIYRNDWDNFQMASRIKTVSGDSLSWDDTGAPASGATRYYWVEAETPCHTSNATGPNPGFRGQSVVATPAGLTVLDSAYCDQVRVTWNAVPDALFYSLYRDTTEIQQLAGTSYFDRETIADVLHDYHVTARTQCYQSPSSPSQPGMGVKTPPPPPANVGATDATICGKIQITWDPVPDAFAYRVTREGVLLADSLVALSFTDSLVPYTREMSYAVKAINVCGVGNYAQDVGRVKKVAAAPSVDASDGTSMEAVEVTWSGGVSTQGYTVMRDGEDVHFTTETSYTDIAALPGLYYEYHVRSHTACGESAPSAPDAGFVDPNAPMPRLVVDEIDLFQDCFPDGGLPWGIGRADMARDLVPDSILFIVPGDSACVTVLDAFGLEFDLSTLGPALYCWVNVNAGSGSAPGSKTGDALSDNPARWPVVDSMLVDADMWYQVRFDTVFMGPGRVGPVPDRYCVDLNDNLFESGDTIQYFFHAISMMPDESYWSEFIGHTRDMTEAAARPMEFQVLPGGGFAAGGDILYVNDAGGTEARDFFDTAFHMLGIDGLVDRFDVRAPGECASNSPGGGRFGPTFSADHLTPHYRTIIWNTGDQIQCLLGDATGAPEKSNDLGLLHHFLYTHPTPTGGGIYLSGNNIAQEWTSLSGPSATLLRDLLPHTLTAGSHLSVGASAAALLTGEPLTLFAPAGVPDSLYAYSFLGEGIGFDVLAADSTSFMAMHYDGAAPDAAAVIANVGAGETLQQTAAVLSGFGYHRIRDRWPGTGGVPERVLHLSEILGWLGHPVGTPVPVLPTPETYANRLVQNRPNPFNPTTTIAFSLEKRTHVSLSIYNVRGQIVRVLVNASRAAGYHRDLVWDGRNGAGERVASGIYFYRLVAGDFVSTRKMVLLK